MSTYVHQKTCTRMSIAALFLQPKPEDDPILINIEWIKSGISIHEILYRNENELATWSNRDELHKINVL